MTHVYSDNLRSAELSRVEIDWLVRILGRLPSGVEQSEVAQVQARVEPTQPQEASGMAHAHEASEMASDRTEISADGA